MNNRRRRLLTLIGVLPMTLSNPRGQSLQSDEATPVAPPVSNITPDLKLAEQLIKRALWDLSEDKALTLNEISASQPDLKTVTGNTVQLALRDLLWHNTIEEVDDDNTRKFRRVRSAKE
jgi:hypothetical protein